MNILAFLHAAADRAKMGKAKSAGLFQAVAEGAVEADMRQPDQGERQCQVLIKNETGCGQCQRPDCRMHDVVGERSDARSQEIAGKTQIGSQKQKREQSPAAADASVKRDCGDQQEKSLGAQQGPHAAVHCTAELVPLVHDQTPSSDRGKNGPSYSKRKS